MGKNIRFGILSTAGVNDYSFLPYAKSIAGVTLTAIASRSEAAAREYANRHGIKKHFGSYSGLLADPDIDCVYIPLPVSMHAEWSIKALEAGKHVLCEKPVAANASQARAITEKADSTGLIFAEAFHYRYHPLAKKVEEIVRSGDIGEITEVSASLCLPLPDRNKVQFKPELGGGALYDTGCYPANFARWIAGCNDWSVSSARCEMTDSGVDGTTRATIDFANGVRGKIHCSLVKFLPVLAEIKGAKGEVIIHAPFSPAVKAGPITIDLYLLIVKQGLKFRSVRVPSVTTYHRQLEAFRDCVINGAAPETNAHEGVHNMRLIDDVYKKAGVGK